MGIFSVYNSGANGITFQHQLMHSRKSRKRESASDSGPNLSEYKDFTSARCLFSKHPRITVEQTFTRAAQHLPETSQLSFFKKSAKPLSSGIVILPIQEFNPEDVYLGWSPPCLAWTHHPDKSYIEINRIQAGKKRGTGLGKSMILSQLPVWKHLNARRIILKAHEMSHGFYENMGFESTDELNNHFNIQNGSRWGIIPMQIDMSRKTSRSKFVNALKTGYERHQQHKGSIPLHIRLPGVTISA